MSEEFLHYIWKFQLLESVFLKGTDGSSIQVLNQGKLNYYAGPDFFNAHIKLNDTQWFGSIEIHKLASDWIRHGHHTDKKYDNVVLHVVWEADQPIYRTDDTLIPTLELKDKLASNSDVNSMEVKAAIKQHQVPCARYLDSIESSDYDEFLDQLALKRLERKVELLEVQLSDSAVGWSQLIYEEFAGCFGLSTNKIPFKELARSIPIHMIENISSDPGALEALFFGQAGFLNDPIGTWDAYYDQLITSFLILNKQLSVTSGLTIQNWNFGKIRPHALPTLRIAQFVCFISKFKQIEESLSVEISLGDWKKLLHSSTSSYWDTHYRFGKASKNQSHKFLSDGFKEKILINAVIPLLLLESKRTCNSSLREYALNLFKMLKSEKNAITSFWTSAGFKNGNAWRSQGLIELNRNYCDQKQCLFCNIGGSILQRVEGGETF